MPDALIHPTPQQLADFGLGKLPEGAAAAVAAHLESCPVCRKAVAAVPPDSFLGKVRAAGPDGSSFPPGLARPDNAQSSAGRPAIAVVPSPDVPPELARHPKYLILRELGRGGMGVVYQARQTVMNRPVVIKVINRSLLERPGVLERFRREIQAAARLSHPNIVTAYDAEQAGDLHMLVMEFVPGQSLAEVLEKKGTLPVSHACHFARQVALGLQHAHERNLVHRDIKPQNLILSLKNQIKILDFGLAKVVREESTSTGLTSSDSCMGTAEYMAPEQAKNARSADIRADLYSLGCTLYNLLAGHPPFREDTWMNTVLAHIQKEPQPLTELRPDVPAALWQVVVRLLAKEPAQRYQKPIEVVQALAPFVKPGTKPVAKDVSSPPPGVKSPVKGTMIEADTNEVKKVLRSVPGKAPPKALPAKEKKASPFADLTTTRTASNDDIVRVSEAAKPYLALWWKRPGVIAAAAIVSLALILATVTINKVKERLANRNTDEHSTSNESPGPVEPDHTKAFVILEVDYTDAKVFIDGQQKAIDIPGNKRVIELAPGTHKLRFSKDGFLDEPRRIELKPGANPPIKIQLKPELKDVFHPPKEPSKDSGNAANPPNPQSGDGDPSAKTKDNKDKNLRPKEGTGKQDDAATLTERGRALMDKGNMDRAIDEFRRAIQLNKNHHGAHCNLGIALRRKGDIEGAIPELRRAIELKINGKECSVAHSNLASALLTKGDLEGAIADCRQTIALKPDDADAYVNLGVALLRQKKNAEAETALRKAIDLKPDDAAAYVNLGAALSSQKKYAEAETALRKAIDLKPDDAAAYVNLGAALSSQKKYAEAETALRKAIDLKPDVAAAYHNLGVVLNRQGKRAEAEAALRKASELKSN